MKGRHRKCVSGGFLGPPGFLLGLDLPWVWRWDWVWDWCVGGGETDFRCENGLVEIGSEVAEVVVESSVVRISVLSRSFSPSRESL